MYRAKEDYLTNFLDFIPTGVCLFKTGKVMLMVKGVALVRKEPPIVSLVIDKRKAVLNALKESGHFELRVLSLAQRNLAAILLRLNGERKRKRQLSDYSKELVSNKKAVATIECKKVSCTRVEDQILLLGEVLRNRVNPTKAPIVYYDKKLAGLD